MIPFACSSPTWENGSMNTTKEPQTAKRKQAFAMAAQLNYTREERLELAEMLLKRDCVSWESLSEPEISRLVDAMEGFALIHYQITQRT